MKTMLKDKSFYLVILSLLVMLSGVACTSQMHKDGMMKEGGKMHKEDAMHKETMMKEGDKMHKEGAMHEDTLMKEGSKTN